MKNPIKIKNQIKTTEQKPKKYNSWISFWRAQTKSKRTVCAVNGCYNKDLVGAHVINVHGKPAKNGYIAPLCNSCNGKINDTFIVDRSLLVKIGDRDYVK